MPLEFILVAPCDTAESLEILGPPNMFGALVPLALQPWLNFWRAALGGARAREACVGMAEPFS
jgi:hypothetical protein